MASDILWADCYGKDRYGHRSFISSADQGEWEPGRRYRKGDYVFLILSPPNNMFPCIGYRVYACLKEHRSSFDNSPIHPERPVLSGKIQDAFRGVPWTIIS